MRGGRKGVPPASARRRTGVRQRSGRCGGRSDDGCARSEKRPRSQPRGTRRRAGPPGRSAIEVATWTCRGTRRSDAAGERRGERAGRTRMAMGSGGGAAGMRTRRGMSLARGARGVGGTAARARGKRGRTRARLRGSRITRTCRRHLWTTGSRGDARRGGRGDEKPTRARGRTRATSSGDGDGGTSTEGRDARGAPRAATSGSKAGGARRLWTRRPGAAGGGRLRAEGRPRLRHGAAVRACVRLRVLSERLA